MKSKERSILQGGKKLPLMEEFYSLQGEGFHVGEAAYFIRIGGCDVGCAWCDTKESWNAELFPPVAVEGVVARAVNCQAKVVIVTGGEPSLYPLDYFTTALRNNGIRTFIETSGAHTLSGRWDWICLSPKKKTPPNIEIYSLANELKVIIHKNDDLQWAEKNAALVNQNCKLFLQAEWSVAESITESLVEYIKQHPKWRISLQAHKYMRIP